MPTLTPVDIVELGGMLRQAREASGVSQGDLARMIGVSRVTINYAEQGRVAIGADTLLQLLSVLGMSITGPEAGPRRSALDLIAGQASVSYRDAVTASQIGRSFATGECDEPTLPYLATILDEVSDGLLLRAVREVAQAEGIVPARVWRNVRALATQVKSPHARWRHAA